MGVEKKHYFCRVEKTYPYTAEYFTASLPVADYMARFRDVPRFLECCRQCRNFGKSWACPPYDYDVDGTIAGYESAFFVAVKIKPDERIPLLFELPFKHKGIMVAPFIGEVSIKDYLPEGQIEQVIAGGENYDGSRPLEYEWVKGLYNECVAADVTFCFIETGTNFVKDGKTYHLPDKGLQSRMAFRSGLQFVGRPQNFKLRQPQPGLFDEAVPPYQKFWREKCAVCGSKIICNGCSNCGRCDG